MRHTRGALVTGVQTCALPISLASLAPPVLAKKDDSRFLAAMETLSASARNAYRALVYETPHFPEFFRQSTPIRQISALIICSRPASLPFSSLILFLPALPFFFCFPLSSLLLSLFFFFSLSLF